MFVCILQSAVGLELWSMSQDILFDNFIITDDYDVAEEWTAMTYGLKRNQIDKEAVSGLLHLPNISTVKMLN